MPDRLEQLRSWLSDEIQLPDFSIEPASGDASFRRYFRVKHDGKSLIAMDAPPEQEDCAPFIGVARDFLNIGLNVPEILHTDIDQGFLLLTDLGEQLYLDVLNESNVERLYGDAMGALIPLQASGSGEYPLPEYDQALLQNEMELFREWFLGRHLDCKLNEQQSKVLDESFKFLEESALAQPKVIVHRDYHSRNLLKTDRHNPGILDFQDAVMGPVTYDLVSLLRDCYIAWPKERVESWAIGYHELAIQSGIQQIKDEELFLRWFDLMGVQRHLKAIGIFSRLYYRDSKPNYLDDIPRTLDYVLEVCARYPELSSFLHMLEDLVSKEGVTTT
jgi:hypothetical protein